MARAAIQLGVRELADAAKVSTNTVTRFERGEPLKDRTVEALQAALETAGVEFIPENGGGPGVRLRKAAKPASGGDEMEVGDEVKYREERAADLKHLGKVGRLIDPGHTPPDPTRVCVEFDGDGGTWVSAGTLVLVRKGKPRT